MDSMWILNKIKSLDLPTTFERRGDSSAVTRDQFLIPQKIGGHFARPFLYEKGHVSSQSPTKVT